MIRDMIAADLLPDYELSEEPGDIIHVRPRRVVLGPGEGPQLSPDALAEARRLAPGADVYVLEADWRGWWVTTGRPRLRSPDAAFLGWVRKRS
jgi:hypothetical protein